MKMDVVSRLQKLDHEKFIELCRMHLTFCLDLHDDEFSALLDLKQEEKVRKGRNYFIRRIKERNTLQSVSLTQENLSQIYQIIEFLGRDANVHKEGLFRKTGSLSRQQELKSLLSVGASIDFSLGRYNVHDCACVLKNFLAELPEPLLSEAHYSAHRQITDMYKEDMSPSQRNGAYRRQLKATRLLLLLLPPNNYRLLKYLLLLLSQVWHAHEVNKMTSSNIATLFAPHIVCPRKMSPESFQKKFPCMVNCVKFLIENATTLFEPPSELVKDIHIYLKQLSSQEINSENEPVKTLVAFCDRTQVDEPNSGEYTNKALSELHTYIQNLPNSARKRKLIKKLHKENTSEPEAVVEPTRKHFRSRSMGETIKKHFLRSKKKEDYCKGFYRSTFDMMESKSTESIADASKSSSMEALCLEKESKYIGKNFLRASKKLRDQKLQK